MNNENRNYETQGNSFSNLASKFKEPTSSSEAVAMNSIRNILKTLQPKRKDPISSGGKYSNKKESNYKNKESKYGSKLYKKGSNAMNIQNGIPQDFYARAKDLSNQIKFQPPDCYSSKSANHKR